MAGTRKAEVEKQPDTQETGVEKQPEIQAGESEKLPANETVYLRYDDNHKRPLFVCVNGKGYRIKRGENVEVPKEVAEVVRNAQVQEDAAMKYFDSIEDKNLNE